MKIIIALLMILFLMSSFVQAANILDFSSPITTGTETIPIIPSSGTITIGTETIPIIPYIIGITITPSFATITAGDSMSLFVDAIYSTGEIFELSNLSFSCDNGTITNGIFSSHTAGRATIAVSYAGVTGQAFITVLPAVFSKIEIDMSDTFDYGQIYPISGLIEYKTYDKYDNSTKPKGVIDYTIKKNENGILLKQLSTSSPSGTIRMLALIIKSGYVIEDGNILFFERGNYTVTAKSDDVTTTKQINVEFSSPFTSIEAWKDYKIDRIDLEKMELTVSYLFDVPVSKTINIPTQWANDFYGDSRLKQMRILCYGHYLILQNRAEAMKELKRKQMNMLLNAIIKGDIVK